MQLILITGLSGSGKSVALNVLEDSGYYCVDNLPANLLPEVITSLRQGYKRVAVSVDVRSGDTLNQLPDSIEDLKRQGIDMRILFLDAKNDTLIKRYSETRRRHPLSDQHLTITECIERERHLLDPINELGYHIDTSDLSPNTLRGWIKDFIKLDRSRLTLLFQSFGFKLGIPLDADFVFDVRCLPNPHYDPRLRPFTGKDPAIVEFLEQDERTQRMRSDIEQFIENWLPCFIRDNRSYLTIAIGCTGGQHRSVYFTEKLALHFQDEVQVLVRHRELDLT